MIPGIQFVFTPRCSMWQLMYARTQGWPRVPKIVCTCTVYTCVCVCVCVCGGGDSIPLFRYYEPWFP